MQPTIACILVNWNNWQDTSSCLASLALQDYPALHVIVVDNGSTNDSLARLRAAHPWAAYIDHGSNAGFPRACNLGAAHAPDADFIWLLNNDTVAPPDTASKLVAHALANPSSGVIGAVLYFASHPTRVQAWGGGSISRWTAYNTHYVAPTPIGPGFYVTFASAFIRRTTFDQLNGLFEGAFMYFEDADFCIRARAAGWQISVVPGTAILHKEGGSSPGRNLRVERIITHSGLLFLRRHSPIPILSCALFLALRMGKRLLRLELASFRAVLNGINNGGSEG